MTQEQAAEYLAGQIAGIAQATVEEHPGQTEEVLEWLRRLSNQEAVLEAEDLKHPSSLENLLSVTSPFQTVEVARVEKWAKAPRGKAWIDEAESLLTKES